MIEAIVAGISGSGRIPPGLEFDDLVSWGIEGLIKAHRNFNPDKGSQFKTYAYYRIKGEVLDKIRVEWRYRNPNDYNEYKRRVRERIADVTEEALDTEERQGGQGSDEFVYNLVSNSAMVCLMSYENLEIPSEVQGTRDPEIEYIDGKETVLWDEINDLEEDEKRLIEMFYVHGYKQKEIAEKLNCSRSTICRMHMKVLEKLKHRLKHYYEE